MPFEGIKEVERLTKRKNNEGRVGKERSVREENVLPTPEKRDRGECVPKRENKSKSFSRLFKFQGE